MGHDSEETDLEETEDIEIPLSDDLLPKLTMSDDEEGEYILVLRRSRAGKQLDIHHTQPRSRGGKDEKDNLTVWRRKFHITWHQLFSNMTLAEIHKFIDIINEPGGLWTRENFNSLRAKLISETEAKSRRRERRNRNK